MSRGHIAPGEWRRVLLLAVLVMAITTVPYVAGWYSSTDDWTFGGFVFGADDGNSYLAKMRLGARGDWLFTLRYTHESHDGALLFLPYILLGKLAALFASPDSPQLVTALIVTFHAARIVFGVALLLVSYRFAAQFLARPGTRMIALVLIALGGGLGWLLPFFGAGELFGSLPVDFFIPEAFSFLILYGLPHLALSRTALLLGLLLLFRALHEPDQPRAWLRWTFPAGALWAVMGLSVPFYIAVLYLLLGCWGLAAWVRLRRFPWALFWRASSAALVPLPVLAYSAVVFTTNDVMGQWSSQNNLPAPHPLHYVFAYGMIALPAVIALRWAWRRGRDTAALPYVLLVVWAAIMPLAVYLPVNVQRRLAEGVIVPISILAAAGLRLWFPARRAWRRARVAVLLPASLTSVVLVLGGLVSALNVGEPLFHARDDVRGMERLESIAPRDAVVLCTKETGNYLPAHTGLVAYAGHGPETLDGDLKIDTAERFFSGALDARARDDLLAVVDYIFFGTRERELAGTSTPDWLAVERVRLVEGFAPGDAVVVYEVLHGD